MTRWERGMVPCGPMRLRALVLLMLAAALFASCKDAKRVNVGLRTKLVDGGSLLTLMGRDKV